MGPLVICDVLFWLLIKRQLIFFLISAVFYNLRVSLGNVNGNTLPERVDKVQINLKDPSPNLCFGLHG